MKNLLQLRDRAERGLRQRGSALLVSLMIMVGLSLLGLAFVSISETETAISVNERNHTQTVALAEAGAKMVVQWFQDPDTMNTRLLMPNNSDSFKTLRNVAAYTGYYKPAISGVKLCSLPYNPAQADQFFGDEANADVWIKSSSTTTPANFLSTLTDPTKKLLFPNTDSGEITDIRIYAPPIVGGTQVTDPAGNKFWVGGTKYGTATIRVTAQKKNSSGGVIAEAIVRIMVAPFPLPGPTGAIESKGVISSGGNFDVYWGTVESLQPISLSKTYSSIPWFDPYDIAHIERGYDSSTVWKPSKIYIGNIVYPLGETVRPTTASAHEYVAIQAGAGTSTATEPVWPTTANAQIVDGGVTWQERAPTMYPINNTNVDPQRPDYDNHQWLFEVMGNNNANVVDDPWITERSAGSVSGNGTAPHPFPYAKNPPGAFPWGFTHYFQSQTFNQPPLYKQTVVPQFSYAFWKDAAVAGRGQKGVKYLSWVSSGTYTDGVTTKTATNWLATGTGFYFFDTQNGLNPQNGGPGIKDPGSADPCGFSGGFVFANFTTLGSTGCPGGGGYYPSPAELYRDVGYRKVVETTAGTQTRGQWATDAAGKYVVVGAFSGQWDFQDLDWSNLNTVAASGSGTKNKFFDVYMAQKTVRLESSPTNATDWVPVQFYPGCKPGNNTSCPSCNCSEPHEAYLNIKYTNVASGFALGWDNPTTAGQPKKLTPNDLPTDTPVTCSAGDVASLTGQQNCTTNAYDDQGGLVNNFFKAIHTVGVFYNEGNWSSTGNNIYFGSIQLGGTFNSNGTMNVYFDDRLLHGRWPPPGVSYPRVLVTSEQIQ